MEVLCGDKLGKVRRGRQIQGREWMRRNSCGGEQWIVAQEKERK
jgi:hypothetical protein